MYCRLPVRPADGLVSAQPGMTSGMEIGSLLPWPSKSPPALKGQRGVPSLSEAIAASSHPRAIQPAGPRNPDGVGTCHRTFITKLRPTLKSESPLRILRSHHGTVGLTSPAKLSPAKLPEDVSSVLLQVNAPCTCNPCLICFTTFTSRASYQDLLCQRVV